MVNVITIVPMKAGTPGEPRNRNFLRRWLKGSFVKALDIVVIALSIVLTLTIASLVYSGERSSSHVIIRGPDKTWIFPLDTETQVDVPGLMGETRVRIHNGEASIVSSPCGGQTCVAAGALHKNGQWAACLPNQVMLLIEGADGGDATDALSW